MRIWLLYIDPGSGSYLVQVIIAAILGGLFYFKNLWLKFRSFFTRGGKDAHPHDDPGNEAANDPEATDLSGPRNSSKNDHETP
jgi:hypothetical protein